MENASAERQRATARALICLALVVLAGMTAIVFLTRKIPSADVACTRTCAAEGKTGKRVYQYSKEQTAGMRGRGPAQCDCR